MDWTKARKVAGLLCRPRWGDLKAQAGSRQRRGDGRKHKQLGVAGAERLRLVTREAALRSLDRATVKSHSAGS